MKELEVKGKPNLLLQFLNNALRGVMNNLGYVEIGKSGKYFHKAKNEAIDDLTMYNGYRANFVILESGFYLRVDSAKKIVRNETVLDFINKLMNLNKDKEKDERRTLVKEALVGSIVITNYGKMRYYTI